MKKTIAIGILFLALATQSATHAQEIDPNFHYLLSTEASGNEFVLESGNALEKVALVRKGPTAGQSWVLVPQGQDFFRLYSNWTGGGYSLESSQADLGSLTTPWGSFSGQFWKITPQGNGFHKLSSMFLGEEMALEGSTSSPGVRMTKWASKPTQKWKLTKLGSVQNQAKPIPALLSTRNNPFTEGEAAGVVKSTGIVKGITLFVNFNDLKAAETSVDKKYEEMLGDDRPQKFFTTMSGNRLDLRIEKTKEWKTLPASSNQYLTQVGETNNFNFKFPSKPLIDDAKALYPDVVFSNYDFVALVVPEVVGGAFAIKNEKAFIYGGRNVPGKGGHTFIHEVGHLMGLPDLNHKAGPIHHALGPWDVMALGNGESTVFFGWHKHKLGWLNDSRKTYLESGSWTGTLAPLVDFNDGLGMIVIPDPTNCAKVYVIEVASAFNDIVNDTHHPAEGILVYSVDANILSGQFPIRAITRSSPASESDHDNMVALNTAPFLPGDDTANMEHIENKSLPFTLKVMNKIHKSYRIQVQVTEARSSEVCVGI